MWHSHSPVVPRLARLSPTVHFGASARPLIDALSLLLAARPAGNRRICTVSSPHFAMIAPGSSGTRRDMIMSKYLHLGARLAALAAFTGLAACAGDPLPTEQPTFYRSMASAEAKVDGPTAASMITGYRHNNGLGAV